MKNYYLKLPSPVGLLTLVANDRGLMAILWETDDPKELRIFSAKEDENFSILVAAAKQLQEYFAKKRRQFDLPLDLQGTDFQKRVWAALLTIPYGKTASYLDIAKKIHHPKAVRAVGMATGKNPVSIMVPCHRIIGSNGKLTGFAGGLTTKKFLLHLEGNEVNE